jgi:thioredoxin 1
MAGLGVLEVSDATFDQEVLKSEQPVLVDFWAVWCGPCKAIAPTVDAVAAKYAGQLKVAKVNVDQNGATPSRYNIRGIPALLSSRTARLWTRLRAGSLRMWWKRRSRRFWAYQRCSKRR